MLDEMKTASQFKKGNADAFRALFDEYSDRLYRFFLVKTRGQREASEDLVQETFLKTWRGRESFDVNRSFKSWLFGIGYNAFIDSTRKAQVTVPIDEYEIADDRVNIEDRTHEKLMVEKVLNKLKDFPKESQEIIVMSYYSGLTSAEVGEILDKKPAAVRMIRMRTLTKLQELLKGGEAE